MSFREGREVWQGGEKSKRKQSKYARKLDFKSLKKGGGIPGKDILPVLHYSVYWDFSFLLKYKELDLLSHWIRKQIKDNNL